MEDDTSITPDSAIIPLADIARHKRVSRERVAGAAKELGIPIATTPTNRKLTSYRQSVRIGRHIDSRAKK